MAAALWARQDNGGGGKSGTDELLNLLANPYGGTLSTNSFFASLGTSLGATAVIALLFCFLRPYNNVVYAPRAKHADSKHAPPAISKGILGWIPPLMRTKEQDMVDKVGLDAAIFMRFTRMCRNMFVVLSIVGCGVLIPVYLLSANQYTPQRKRQDNYSTGQGVSFFYKLTPQNMYFSKSFWALVVIAYVFDIVVCYFLYHNYVAVLRLRRAYLDSPDYQRSLHARTLLLTDIPNDYRTDDGIVRLTDEIRATDSVPRAAIARNVKELPELVEEHEDAVRKLEKYLAKYLKNPDKLPAQRPMCKASSKDKTYSKGQKVDAIEYLTSRIKNLEVEIKEVRETIDKRNALSYGFASYDQISEAHGAAYLSRKKGPHGSIVRLAPRPNDLVWKNLKMAKKDRNWQNFINNLWVAVLTLFWTAPNVFIAVFLANLANLGKVWPAFNQSLLDHPKWWAVVQGVAAPAVTNIFYFYLPAIFRKLCVSSGDVTKTSRERHVMHKLYTFFVVNNLIIFSIFAALWGFVVNVINANKEKNEGVWEAITHGKFFLSVITTLCQISPYWIGWLLQRNLGAAVDISQVVNLAWGSISRKWFSPTPRELIELSAPQPFDYAGYYNYFCYYATVALAFATIQPLVLPVVLFYFFLDSWLKKYLLLYVFITKYESGGMFWRTIFNRMLVAAFLGNVVVALVVVAFGSVGINWAMLASLGPLPFLLAAFRWYCARKFDDQIHYYQKGNAIKDREEHAGAEHKTRKSDRVGVRFGHPVLYKALMTPMVSAKSQHLLKQIYSGRTSVEDSRTVGGYSDVYLDAMDSNAPGKASGKNPAPFELVDENQMDFEHYKNRPEFRDEAGGDGELYGRAADLIRPGTPSTIMTGVTRTGTMDTYDRSRSTSRHDRNRSDDSDSTRVAPMGGTDYPRGYHQTPNMREQSPAGSDFGDGFAGRGRPGLGHAPSREGLVGGAARMGMSPPPKMPGGYGNLRSETTTPGQESTSYDYFRRGRGL
nr:hypothetical protein B0A51_04208 [Rachicladosporium sp. CCFEE 5018]